MARTARKVSSIGIYHVMMRGINRMQIFDDDKDCMAFLRLIQRVHECSAIFSNSDQYPWDLYAYALMGNHFHLLVKVRNVEIGEVIKQIASSYVFYFNHRHGRDGHLFRERFKSEPCEDMEYLFTLLRYIHQNPVAGGRCKRVEDYRDTSWHEYLGKVSPERCLCNTQEVLEMIPFEELKNQVENSDSGDSCIDYHSEVNRHISDYEISSYLQSNHNIFNPSSLLKMPREQRNRIVLELKQMGAGVRQLQRLTGIGAATISRINE